MIGDETYFCFLPVQVEESKNSTTSDTVHSVFKNAIQLLREKGLLFQKDGGGDKLYYVRDLQLKFLFVASITYTFLLRTAYLLVSKIIIRRRGSQKCMLAFTFSKSNSYHWFCETVLICSPGWP